MNYTITRYEEQNGRLFISINSPNTYIEHFFHDDEMGDIEGAIAQLIAELELKEEEFTPQSPVIDKLIEVQKMVINPAKIELAKMTMVANKVKEKPILKK
jgi:hypothetical protein